jgi:chemotaxis protein MotB
VRWAWFLVILSSGCAATVPKTEHDAQLAAEQAKYEDRLRRSEDERQRSERVCTKDKADLTASEKSKDEQVEQLESQLADKQRTLDDVASQLVELQDAFSKLNAKERSKLEAMSEKERAQKAAVEALAAHFKELLKEEIGQKRVELLSKDAELLVRFKDGALYAKGSAKLVPSSKPTLERLAKAIKTSPDNPLRIEVHTDAVRAQEGGERKETWTLTEEQGLGLVRSLQKDGVDPSRLSYTSFGQFKPMASNDTEDGRSSNRRVELIVGLPILATKK